MTSILHVHLSRPRSDASTVLLSSVLSTSHAVPPHRMSSAAYVLVAFKLLRSSFPTTSFQKIAAPSTTPSSAISRSCEGVWGGACDHRSGRCELPRLTCNVSLPPHSLDCRFHRGFNGPYMKSRWSHSLCFVLVSSCHPLICFARQLFYFCFALYSPQSHAFDTRRS